MFYFVFRYQRRKGIIIHETSIVVYAQLLTGNRYQLKQNGEVYLEKQWSKQVLPFVYQTVVKVNTEVRYLLVHNFFRVGECAEEGVSAPLKQKGGQK